MRGLSTVPKRSLGDNGWSLQYTQRFPFESVGDLKGKTVIVSGATRGIGLAIGLRCAQDGANVAILGKTVDPHPRLEGTIHTAAEEVEKAGGNALPLVCDIRFEDQVSLAVDAVLDKFGGVDVLINNASAINLVDTQTVTMKTYDLMHGINCRGTFLMSKTCIPHLKKAQNAHIMNLAPPLNMEARWFKGHVAYSIAKFGMSMQVLGLSEELKDDEIAVNGLWPRTFIATAAVNNLFGGDNAMQGARKPEIMADAAHIILTSCSKKTTGNFFIDDEVLELKDLSEYNVDSKSPAEKLLPDIFL